jgi:hypothetical protein
MRKKSGPGVHALGFRVEGKELRASNFGIKGLNFHVQGFRFRVKC